MDNSLGISPQTPTNRPTHKMSSSLKKRLQKLGRYHGSRVPPKIQRKTLAWSSPLQGTCAPIDTSLDIDTNNDSSPNSSIQDVSESSDLNALPETAENCAPADTFEHSAIRESVEDALEVESMALVVKNEEDQEAPMSKEDPLDGHSFREDCDRIDLGEKLAFWTKKVQEKQELLRKLKLVKLYRTKNDVEDLKKTIARWRTACQNALREYEDKCQGKAPLTDIIAHLQISNRLIHYDPDDGSFMD